MIGTNLMTFNGKNHIFICISKNRKTMQNQPFQIAPDNQRVIGTKAKPILNKIRYAYAYRKTNVEYYLFSITEFDSKMSEHSIAVFLCPNEDYLMGLQTAQDLAMAMNSGTLQKLPKRMSFNEAKKYLQNG